MSLEIREMTATDLAEVRNVARKTWADTYSGIIPGDIRKEFVERVYDDELLVWRGERGVFLVAEGEGVIVGFADFNQPFEDDLVVGLAAIYVLPDEQRRGAGTALLLEGLRRFPKAVRVVARFEKENRAARRFYERHGFEKAGEYAEDFLGHPSRMVEMVVKLGASEAGE